MNVEKGGKTDVLTTFKKIDDEDLASNAASKSKHTHHAKANTPNNNYNENLNKIFGTLVNPNKQHVTSTSLKTAQNESKIVDLVPTYLH